MDTNMIMQRQPLMIRNFVVDTITTLISCCYLCSKWLLLLYTNMLKYLKI